MFNDLPPEFAARMAYLEALDARDRTDGTERLRRLRQIPPSTGRVLALLAASAPPGLVIEIGASAGYSTLWLALACRESERRLTTYEVLDEKAALAAETLALTGAGDVVDLVHGDALDHLGGLDAVGFCFLDAEKDVYAACYDAVVPKLAPGGLLVADNAVGFEDVLQPMIDAALVDGRVDATVVHVDRGLLVCRRRRGS